MPYDDDNRPVLHHEYEIIPDPPLTVVPVSDDKAAAIRAFLAEFPNLGSGSALSEVRHRGFPDLTMDEVRTVMASED